MKLSFGDLDELPLPFVGFPLEVLDLPLVFCFDRQSLA
jgi:hypothetical protein